MENFEIRTYGRTELAVKVKIKIGGIEAKSFFRFMKIEIGRAHV